MAYLDLRDHASAAQYLNDCLNLDSTNYACLDNLGVADIQAASYDAALQTFNRAHGLEPERPEALVNFGYLADLRGDWKRAVAYYVQAIAVNPYVPESYVNLGIDFEHNGLYSLAQAALIKGVAAAPYDGRVRYLLARAYAAQGQKALALARAQSCRIHPSIPTLRRLRKKKPRGSWDRRRHAPISTSSVPSDAVDFYASAAWKGGDRDSRARRLRKAEILFVDGVDGSEIVDIDEKDRRLHDVDIMIPGGAENRAEIFNHALCLRGDITADELACLRIECDLTAAIKLVATLHRLAVGADRPWRVRVTTCSGFMLRPPRQPSSCL